MTFLCSLGLGRISLRGEQICDSFSLDLHGSQDLGRLLSPFFSPGLMLPHSFWSVLRGGLYSISISGWLSFLND